MKIAASVLLGLVVAFAAPAQAGVTYNLQATNINAFLPSTLFTNDITGYVVVPDNIGPGGSIGLSLLSGAFNIGGYQFTLADFAPGSDFNGRISTDGQSISFLSSGYNVKPTVAACANGCYGSFDIAQNQQSNLLVFSGDQIGGDSIRHGLRPRRSRRSGTFNLVALWRRNSRRSGNSAT